MGIRPGIYLTVLYSIILLAVIFFLLMFPGIKTPMAALIVNTEPAGAAIRVNDVYMGLSGSRIIIPKGTHTIEVVMPGFETIQAVHTIPGRVFGSLFFPRSFKIDFVLKTTDPIAAFTIAAADFATWSFGGEPSEAWQIPMSLSEGAYRIGPYIDSEQFHQILLAASRFAVTRAALRDLVRAKILLDNYGNAPSPLTLIGSVTDIISFLSEKPGSAAWLSNLLQPGIASVIRASAWANNEYEAETDFFPDFDSPSGLARFQLAGLNFTGKNAGRLLSGGIASIFRPFGHNININYFMISETPVPRSLFETFLNENPEWAEHLTNYFPDEINFNPVDAYNRAAVSGVTWYAANAFCKWLTERLPPSMADMEVRLPTEAEWEYAALSIDNMNNAGWEWCADPFAPLQFINAPQKAINAIGSAERTLRGRQSAGAVGSRASLPPDFSSPFVTFRPVIAQKID
jgi:hypothetical protein